MINRAISIVLTVMGVAALGYAAVSIAGSYRTAAAAGGFYANFTVELLLAISGSFLLLMAALVVDRTPTRPRSFPLKEPGRTVDAGSPKSAESPLQFHPFNQVAYKHYLDGLNAPPKERKVKITESVAALAEGRNPVVLAEFLAAQLAIAGSGVAESYLKSHLPHLEKPIAFQHRSVKGTAFLFEGIAFVVLAGPEKETLWNRVRASTALRTGRRQSVPGETVWDAAPRHRGFAEDWDALRDTIETWVKDVVLKGDSECAFVFSGYARGGALAVLGAYEFAKRGRNVAGIVTFSAPHPGGKAFAAEFDRLGLDEKTLRIEAACASGRIVQPLCSYVPVGRVWSFTQQAPLSRDVPQDGNAGPKQTAGIHLDELLGNYALPMTALVYRRLRELAIQKGTADEYDASYAALGKHLAYMRGAGPEEPRDVFQQLKDLPIRVKDSADLEKLKATFPHRIV